MNGADQFHIAQTAFELLFHAGRQFFRRHVFNRFGFIAVHRNHCIGQMLFQRQQRNGAAVVEAFICSMQVGQGMLHAAHKHGAAVIVHIGRNAQLTARLREAAIRGQQQTAGQYFAAFQNNLRLIVRSFDFFNIGAGQNFHVVQFGHDFISGFADIVVGNQIAQAVRRLAARLSRLREVELVIGMTVQHFGIAQRINFVFWNQIPHTQSLHDFARQVCQCDFTAVIRRILQHF